MAIVVDRELNPSRSLAAIGELGWLAVAGGASLAAGAVHAAAIGVHSEHRQAVLAFTLVAAVQLGWGALLLARPGRIVLALGALANVGAIAGWVTAKVNGIPFIDGLDVKEPLQTADGIAAGLAVVAVISAALIILSGTRRPMGHPMFVGTAAVLVASLAVPGMISAGTHGHASASDHGTTNASEHPESGGQGAAHVAAVVPPKPYDPTLPIDLSGVDGVTPQQQARAENLLSITITRLPKFNDPAVAESMGFVSIGDGALGHEHYLNPVNMNDDKILDPDFPESLVYDTSVTPKRLAAAMFMMNPGDTLTDVPEVGGKLTQWHIHDNLCFVGPRVVGLTDGAGKCAPGQSKGAETPMIHVWITPHPCGPFAALEGVGAGSIAPGEERLCDEVHGA